MNEMQSEIVISTMVSQHVQNDPMQFVIRFVICKPFDYSFIEQILKDITFRLDDQNPSKAYHKTSVVVETFKLTSRKFH